MPRRGLLGWLIARAAFAARVLLVARAARSVLYADRLRGSRSQDALRAQRLAMIGGHRLRHRICVQPGLRLIAHERAGSPGGDCSRCDDLDTLANSRWGPVPPRHPGCVVAVPLR